jgi:two-component system NarL family response regulator
MNLNLLIVDDHAVVREGLEAMLRLEVSFTSIATASSGTEAMQVCVNHLPDVILLDVRMPGTDGFSTLEELMQNWPNIRVIMLSASANAAEIKLARRLSSAGYLSKSTDRVTLVRAIKTVAAGGTCFTAASDTDAGTQSAQLSPRELEVVRHLGRGLSNHDIGRILGISEHTIKSHLKSIFAKLDVVDRAEALGRAYAMGLVTVEA